MLDVLQYFAFPNSLFFNFNIEFSIANTEMIMLYLAMPVRGVINISRERFKSKMAMSPGSIEKKTLTLTTNTEMASRKSTVVWK